MAIGLSETLKNRDWMSLTASERTRNGLLRNQACRGFWDYHAVLTEFNLPSNWELIIAVFTYRFQEPNASSFTPDHGPTTLIHPLLLKHESLGRFPSRQSSTSYDKLRSYFGKRGGGGAGERQSHSTTGTWEIVGANWELIAAPPSSTLIIHPCPQPKPLVSYYY